MRAGRIDRRGARILEEVQRDVFGGNAVFGMAREGTKGSEAGTYRESNLAGKAFGAIKLSA